MTRAQLYKLAMIEVDKHTWKCVQDEDEDGVNNSLGMQRHL